MGKSGKAGKLGRGKLKELKAQRGPSAV